MSTLSKMTNTQTLTFPAQIEEDINIQQNSPSKSTGILKMKLVFLTRLEVHYWMFLYKSIGYLC